MTDINYYGVTPAGSLTKEQTLLSIARLAVAGSTLITKGNVCIVDGGNALVVATSGQSSRTWYVALETVDNSEGSTGALSAPLAKRNHFVTVVANGSIVVGTGVKVAQTPGQVIQWVEGTDSTDLLVGIYHGQEGGKIFKSTTTPFAEFRGAEADFLPVDAVDGDIIEVELA